ncbi:MAG TPA: YciI family protein [Eoetvoesiella sp.]
MPYLIETFDKKDHQAVRQAHRQAHLVFLEQNKKLLLACGAKLLDDGTDAGGGIYLVDVDTREEAQALIDADPFHKDGNLFERVIITRWRKAYLDGECYI